MQNCDGSCTATRRDRNFREVIDVQTLLPFDIHHVIVDSVKRTNRVLFTDEDVPGGATAFMMQKVLEEQDAYIAGFKAPYVPAKEHRPAYASDGDYFSKPNAEDVFDVVYEMMHESDPEKFPAFINQICGCLSIHPFINPGDT